MAEKRHIFLIPGFFGFANIGGLLYFAHVVEYLGTLFQQLGLPVELHRVQTHPTASIRKRAAALLEAIAATEAGQSGMIDLIGHSTGGLDARLLATPQVSLPSDIEAEPIARRIRTVVTVSTPHYGTPLATVLTTLYGRQLLRVLSLSTMYVLRFGHLPMSAMLKLAAILVRLDDRLGLTNTVADQLFNDLLGDFSPERRRDVQRYLKKASLDQALLGQVTPEGADLFNAGAADREGTRYGSVVSMAPQPGVRSFLRVGLDPYGHATHALFHLLYRASSTATADNVPAPALAQSMPLREYLPRLPSTRDNDGVVPTNSQLWGDVVHAAEADHLDVIGHFGYEKHDPPHYDWLASGSAFDRAKFEHLWTDVAHFLAHDSPAA